MIPHNTTLAPEPEPGPEPEPSLEFKTNHPSPLLPRPQRQPQQQQRSRLHAHAHTRTNIRTRTARAPDLDPAAENTRLRALLATLLDARDALLTDPPPRDDADLAQPPSMSTSISTPKFVCTTKLPVTSSSSVHSFSAAQMPLLAAVMGQPRGPVSVGPLQASGVADASRGNMASSVSASVGAAVPAAGAAVAPVPAAPVTSKASFSEEAPTPTPPTAHPPPQQQQQQQQQQQHAFASLADAQATVQRHIRLLHAYNAIRDVGQGLLGLVAEGRGVRVVDVMAAYGLGVED